MSNEDKTMVFDTPDAIEYAQLASAKMAIKLEKAGMKHSSGRSMKALWARHFGMPGRPSHDAVMDRIQSKMDMLLAAKMAGVTYAQLYALCEYADEHGDTWKDDLLLSWERGGDHAPELQQLRNQKGPSWLAKVPVKFYTRA